MLGNFFQCHEHRHYVETVRLAMVNDQLDPSNLLCMKQTVRRLVQLEMALSAAPLGPTVSASMCSPMAAVSSRGAVRAQRFSTWIAESQKERAQTVPAVPGGGRELASEPTLRAAKAAAAAYPHLTRRTEVTPHRRGPFAGGGDPHSRPPFRCRPRDHAAGVHTRLQAGLAASR